MQRIVVGVCLSLALAVGVLPSVGAAAPTVPVWDDFSNGFSVGPIGSSAKWFYFATPDGCIRRRRRPHLYGGPDTDRCPQGQQPKARICPPTPKPSRKSRPAASPADWTT